jgi:hypothetical protein
VNTCAGILTSLFFGEMFQRLAILSFSGKKLKILHLRSRQFEYCSYGLYTMSRTAVILLGSLE